MTKEIGNAPGRPALPVGTPALRRPPRLPTAAQCNTTTPPAFTKKPPQPPNLSVKKGHRSANVPTLLSDGKLRMRIRREYTWQSAWVQTNEVHYVYDGNLPIQERDLNNLPVNSYTRGRDLSGSLQGAGGIGGMLAMSVGSISPQHYYYHADGNGNNTALINSRQFIAAKYLYDPYGNLLSPSGPMAAINHYRFSSKEALDNSGLVYYLYRFYDPSLQRWPNQDPMGELGFESLRRLHAVRMARPGDINSYRFVANSPLENTDPLGLDCLGDCAKQYRNDVIGCALGVGIGFAVTVTACSVSCAATGPGYAFCIGFCIGYFGSPAIDAFLTCVGVASAKDVICNAHCPCPF